MLHETKLARIFSGEGWAHEGEKTSATLVHPFPFSATAHRWRWNRLSELGHASYPGRAVYFLEK